MSWIEFYNLFEKYDGDIKKATPSEMRSAARGNPNDPVTAMHLAARKFQEKCEKEGITKFCFDKHGLCEPDNCHCNK